MLRLSLPLTLLLTTACSEYGLMGDHDRSFPPGTDPAEDVDGDWLDDDGADEANPTGDPTDDPWFDGDEPTGEGSGGTPLDRVDEEGPDGSSETPDTPAGGTPLDRTDDEELIPDGDADDDGASDRGRMTGGGVVLDDIEVSYGFTLHCAGSHHSNHLQINWDGGSFHLEDVNWVDCSDDPALSPGMPSVGNDTLEGEGVGRLNGHPASIWFHFTDDGEPGVDDHAAFEIRLGAVSSYREGYTVGGNHQAHDPIGH